MRPLTLALSRRERGFKALAQATSLLILKLHMPNLCPFDTVIENSLTHYGNLLHDLQPSSLIFQPVFPQLFHQHLAWRFLEFARLHAAQLEGAKAAAAHAARSVQAQAPDAAVAVSVAKSHCGRFATEILRDCVQMHGGIGLTWEHDLHFYVRRAVSNEMLWGSPAVHHERLCRLAGL